MLERTGRHGLVKQLLLPPGQNVMTIKLLSAVAQSKTYNFPRVYKEEADFERDYKANELSLFIIDPTFVSSH